MEERDFLITFDESVKAKVLQSLGISKNKDGFLIDNNSKVLTNSNFEVIEESNFGGILQGSKIAITKDRTELARYFLKRK